MSIFNFKKRKKKNSIANKLNSILKYRGKLLLPVFLFILIISTASIITLANFGGGQTDDTPNLQRGLVGHWTMDSSSYVEGTENLVPDADLQNRSHADYQPVFDSRYQGGVALKNESGNKTQYILINDIPTVAGEVYTLTTRHYFSEDFNTSLRTAFCLESNGKHHNLFASKKGEWETRSLTFTAEVTGNMRTSLYMSNTFTEGYVIIDWIQVERKGHATSFVNGTRQTRLADSTPYENHGTSNIETSPSLGTDRFGNEGGATEFNGNQPSGSPETNHQYIDIPESPIIRPQAEWTVSGWVKPDLLAQTSNGAGIFDYGSNNRISVQVINSGVRINVGGVWGAINRPFSDVGAGVNDWIHVVAVYDNSNGTGSLKLYFNNQEVGSINGIAEPVNHTQSAWIGTRKDHYSHTLKGSLDDIRLYNRALSEQEISLLYDSYKPQLQVSSLNSGLVGHWTLDEVDYNPSTNRVSDLTPYSNHGNKSGGSFEKDRFGKDGGVWFSGYQNNEQVNNLSNLYFYQNDSFSWSAWLKLGTVHTERSGTYLWGTYNGVVNITTNTGRIGLRGFPSCCSLTNIGENFPVEEWAHLTVTFKNGSIKTYINGVHNQTTILDYSGNYRDIRMFSVIGGNGHSVFPSGDLWASDVKLWNRELSVNEVDQLYNSYKPKVTPNLQKGLVLDMPLTSVDYNSSTERVSDRTPYENHGVNNGATITNEGAQFNGTTQYIGNIDTINPEILEPESITVSSWIKMDTDASTSRHIWFTKWYGYSNEIEANTRLPYFRLRGPGDTKSNTPITLGVWHHFVGTYDPLIGGRVYLDGKLVGSRGPSGAINHSRDWPLNIGRYFGGIYFKGMISNARIYNRALSAEEVELLYARGR